MRLSLRLTAKYLTFLLIVLFVNVLFWNDLFKFESNKSNNFQDGGFVYKQPVEYIESKVIVSRQQRSAKSFVNQTINILNDTVNFFFSKDSLTELHDVFISMKSTQKNHKTRLKVVLDTWVQQAKNQTYIFTDYFEDEKELNIQDGHFINTSCAAGHKRQALCCKMSLEYDYFVTSGRRWWCHVDDDNYLNIPRLIQLLRNHSHTEDWYLGKPSLTRPIEVPDRAHPGQKIAFWFATGGAGFCISRALALKMMPYAGGGRLMRVGDQIRLPDDCTIGYIIDYILNKELTVIPEFHSHLEPLWQMPLREIKNQITLSYVFYKDRKNFVTIRGGFSEETDPTRFWSIHCHLNPYIKTCLDVEDR